MEPGISSQLPAKVAITWASGGRTRPALFDYTGCREGREGGPDAGGKLKGPDPVRSGACVLSGPGAFRGVLSGAGAF
ncbi:hypothetical protein NDU88_000342 [Pleurodeles waltl]|uniref:Uncharacterized protein n=1 Tax=Pleurodeles waltl TaxID=8319 RepID=A0AAV7MKJ7_PLEWA|nr:hypothetical protein NDU88_000342 [Pleurodeles waltl]